MITTFVLTFLLCLFVVMPPVAASAQTAPVPADSVRALLEEVDAAIARKDDYHARKEARIADLRRRLALVADTLEQYALCKQLSDEYLHYQADSAVHYLNRRATLLPTRRHASCALSKPMQIEPAMSSPLRSAPSSGQDRNLARTSPRGLRTSCDIAPRNVVASAGGDGCLI